MLWSISLTSTMDRRMTKHQYLPNYDQDFDMPELNPEEDFTWDSIPDDEEEEVHEPTEADYQ